MMTETTSDHENGVDQATDTQERRLWQMMTRSEEAAEARRCIFERYIPLARRIAGQHMTAAAGATAEFSDLYQLACAGLLEAIDRFDSDRKVPFAAFARKRILGSVLDGLAAMSEVSAQISQRSRLKQERLNSLRAGAPASHDSDDEAQAIVDIAIGLALGFMLEGTGLYHDEDQPDSRPNAYESLAWKDLVGRVAREVDAIGGRERDIIRYHYYDGLDFAQIGALMNLTKGRISQLHRKSVILLRKRLSHAGAFRLTG